MCCSVHYEYMLLAIYAIFNSNNIESCDEKVAYMYSQIPLIITYNWNYEYYNSPYTRSQNTEQYTTYITRNHHLNHFWLYAMI